MVAGQWSPDLTDISGLIPVADSVRRNRRFLTPALITVPLVVTNVSPNTGVNPNGGSKLTIVGEKFPTSLKDGSVVDISFTDGDKCTLHSAAST